MKMRFLLVVSLLAAASAFTLQPVAFKSAPSPVVDRSTDLVEQETAHHERRSTILLDGKANGEFFFDPGDIS
jgi:hypothetical protein